MLFRGLFQACLTISLCNAAIADTWLQIEINPDARRETVEALAQAIPGRTYTVQHGDTLSDIVVRQYGMGSTRMASMVVASNSLKDPNLILADTTLILPVDLDRENVSRIESYRIDTTNESFGALKAELEKDPAVRWDVIETSRIVPNVTGPAEIERVRAENTWPWDKVKLWLENAGPIPQTMVTVGLLDSGLDIQNHQFPLWHNLTEYRGLPYFDDDDNGYLNDIHGFDFVNKTSRISDVASSATGTLWHGTHVGGIVSAMLVTGKYADLRLAILQIMDSDGSTVVPSAVQNAILYGASQYFDVLNLSFEMSWDQQTNRNIETNPGIVFVAAAGNSNIGRGLNLDTNPRYPAAFSANFANVISVAAHDRDGNLASFSNYGAKTVDVAAPGVEISSTIGSSGLFGVIDGTSQAAPFVALTAALLKAKGIKQPRLIKNRIIVSADYDPSWKEKVVAEGTLNILKALCVNQDIVRLKDDSLHFGRLKESTVHIRAIGVPTPIGHLEKVIVDYDDMGQEKIFYLKDGKLANSIESISLTDIVLDGQDGSQQFDIDDVLEIVPALFMASTKSSGYCSGRTSA